MIFSTYLAHALINASLRGVAYSPPTNVYVGLMLDMDSPASGTEVSGGSYAREAVVFSAPGDLKTASSGAITFTTATDAWGTPKYFAIFDSLTGGNMLYFAELDQESIRPVESGDVFAIPSGRIVLDYGNALS